MKNQEISRYELFYDFDKFNNGPQEVFQNMGELCGGFNDFDQLLFSTIEREWSTNTTIVGIEYGSIRAWLANMLKCIEDDDLKKLDWKAIIGKSLVRAKQRAIKFLENEKPASRGDLLELQAEIRLILIKAEIPNLIDVRLVDLHRLGLSMAKINEANLRIGKEERMAVKLDGNDEILPKRMVITSKSVSEMLVANEVQFRDRKTLLVKKPDLIGNSMWDVIYESHKVPMKMGDLDFLMKFHDKEESSIVLSGDSLDVEFHCKKEVDKDGIEIYSKYEIVKVFQVIPGDDRRQLKI